MLIPAPGPRLPPGPVADKSTPKRDGQIGRRPESNGKRASSMNIPSNLDKKRKASQMEDSRDTYDAHPIRPSIKQEPGLPVDNYSSSSGSTSPGALSIKPKLSTGKVLQGHSNANGNSGATIFGPSPRFHDSSGVVKKETNRPGNDRRKASDVKNRKGSSSLSELSTWDVSESEMHTTDIEEESSDGEGGGSVFSLEMDRQSVKSEQLSQGPEYLYREESNDIPSRRATVHVQNDISSTEPTEPATNGHNRAKQTNPMRRRIDREDSNDIPSRRATAHDQNEISSLGPTEPATNGHDRMEQNNPMRRRLSHNHYNHITDETNAIPTNGVHEKIIETTVHGKPRRRAAPKTQVSAREVSRSWKTANPADKMLMKMKLRGCNWTEIRKAWEELTGEWPAASTLPNRYQRVKDNLTRLKSGDVRVLPYLL